MLSGNCAIRVVVGLHTSYGSPGCSSGKAPLNHCGGVWGTVRCRVGKGRLARSSAPLSGRGGIDEIHIFVLLLLQGSSALSRAPPGPCFYWRAASLGRQMNVRWQGTDRGTTGFGKMTRPPLHSEVARPFAFAPPRCATAPAYPRTGRAACNKIPTCRDRVPQFGPVRSGPRPSPLDPRHSGLRRPLTASARAPLSPPANRAPPPVLE